MNYIWMSCYDWYCYFLFFLVDCGEIIAPTNGQVDLTAGTTYESVVVFQCNNGYDLVGESSLECLASGSWDNVKPTCNIKGQFSFRLSKTCQIR